MWFDLTAEGIDAEKDAFLHASCWKKKEKKKKKEELDGIESNGSLSSISSLGHSILDCIHH